MSKTHKQTILETLGRSSIHPFPARMAPGIALDALGDGRRPLRVLDPMMGSGTVLAVAQTKGHLAYGVDVDPLAVLLASVWTRRVDKKKVRLKARAVLRKAKAISKILSFAQAYPASSDKETRQFIRYWFDAYSRKQLSALSLAIARVRDEAIRDVLWCGFSRLIIAKSSGASLAMDLSHSRPHREFSTAPVKPFNRFVSAVDLVVDNCHQPIGGKRGPRATAKLGDARNLKIRDGSIDLILTSPPYLNAIDYMRCSKFSLVWMGYSIDELRIIRGESVGAESALDEELCSDSISGIIKQLRLRPVLSNRNYGLLARYVWDMKRALLEAARVLRAGGRAVYVVGDSTVRGTYVRNSAIVEAVAKETGLALHVKHSRALPANRRYLPPPRKNASQKMDRRMRREVVLVFNKVAA